MATYSNEISNPNSFMEKMNIIDFCDPKTSHDRVLVVGEKKFYVQSVILSMSSDYFRTLFNSDFAEAKQQEIVLKEVEPRSFEYFLKIIYPEHLRGKLDLQDAGMDKSVLLSLVCASCLFLCPAVFKEAKKCIIEELALNGPKSFDLVKLINLLLLHDIKEFKEHIVKALKDPAFAAEKRLEIKNAPEDIKDFVLDAYMESKPEPIVTVRHLVPVHYRNRKY